MLILELAVVGSLILLNGFFAMSELAVVSSRKGRLQQLAQSGSRGARRALKLIEDPTGFLSTVQIGITLVGVLAGAYSGATLAEPLADALGTLSWIDASADELAFVIVVVGITYLSLIVGELVPKRLALSNAEGLASLVAPVLTILARAGAPLVWFLRVSTEAVLAVLRVKTTASSTVTEEEVKSLIAEGTSAGIFEPAEQDMVGRVLRLADRPVRTIMVPRPDVIWLDANDPDDAILDEVRDSGHSRFPVARGDDVDQAVGVVHAKDLLEQQRQTGAIDLIAAMREPLYVSDSMPILKLLDQFRSSSVHMALVLDEHGSLEGVVTPLDILIAITGGLPEREGDGDPDAVRRDDGSWLLDGRMAIDEVERVLDAPAIADGDYATLAGFVLHRLGHIPKPGESFVWRDWRFEVVDLDRRRIDKVLATRIVQAW